MIYRVEVIKDELNPVISTASVTEGEIKLEFKDDSGTGYFQCNRNPEGYYSGNIIYEPNKSDNNSSVVIELFESNKKTIILKGRWYNQTYNIRNTLYYELTPDSN